MASNPTSALSQAILEATYGSRLRHDILRREDMDPVERLVRSVFWEGVAYQAQMTVDLFDGQRTNDGAHELLKARVDALWAELSPDKEPEDDSE